MRIYTTSLGIIGLLTALFALGDSADFSFWNQPVWAAEEDHEEEEGLQLSTADGLNLASRSPKRLRASWQFRCIRLERCRSIPICWLTSCLA